MADTKLHLVPDRTTCPLCRRPDASIAGEKSRALTRFITTALTVWGYIDITGYADVC